VTEVVSWATARGPGGREGNSIRTSFSTLQRESRGFGETHDLTDEVEACVAGAGIEEGLVVVSVPGSTASVTTIEYESGAVADLRNAIERIAPQDLPYAHDARWHDGNGFSHVRAALLGPSVTLPVHEGRLVRGTWQQVVLLDFDNGARTRRVAVQVIGA